MKPMLSLREAQTRLLALAPDMRDCDWQPATDNTKKYLANDLLALRTHPSVNLSAMDGYALGAGDGPWKLVGESRAGAPFQSELAHSECARISTGAHMPAGSERVLIQENAQIESHSVATTQIPPPGKHVRYAGFDFEQGQ